MAATSYPPASQRGLALHIGLIAALTVTSVAALYMLFRAQVGLGFTLLVLLFLATAIPVPILGYRVYALTRADYQLDRETLRLTWGLRLEEIPISDVEWVRPLQGLIIPISLPLFSLPGSIVGTVRHPDIGDVEFMASQRDKLLFIATARRVFAISPENPNEFIRAFQHAIEMGSLSSARPRSQYPSFVVGDAWEQPVIRYLWAAGILLNVGLFIWVSIVAPGLEQVSVGFTPFAEPLPPVPGIQLILLPILSSVLYTINLLTGLFFYRRPDQRPLAATLWSIGTLASLFFVMAVIFILGA